MKACTPLALTFLAIYPATAANTITEADCSPTKLGAAIPPSAIGEPVSAVTLSPPVWNGATCTIDGSMAPIDTSGATPPIKFRVMFPATWTERAAQLGGGGMNGVVPNLMNAPNIVMGDNLPARGIATYGSDSGHAGNPRDVAWALSDEAIRNLGYMQLKKTHDAAAVLIERMYGAKPRFNYFLGTSQGGREALTVAQRYPADYDGIVANVPIVNFSTLMLAPELIRIQEKPAANYVPPAKVPVIAGEFMRQCDSLDGLADGVINNYVACRAIFSSSSTNPWTARRCPNNVDGPDCLTDGQIETLRMVYRPYKFGAPLANGVTSFGMWVPNTDPSGSGLIVNARFRGQEGASDSAPMHSHLGVLGVTGFLMKDPTANPLDYIEGGKFSSRRAELSAWLDSTSPDLSKFQQRGGKLIVTIGTNDTLASPGAQLDYFQSLINKMGQAKLDTFARLFVIPQTNHGLAGKSYGPEGAAIPNTYDRFAMLTDWVENKKVPGASAIVTAGDQSRPLCQYPAYPKYVSGPATQAASYVCTR